MTDMKKTSLTIGKTSVLFATGAALMLSGGCSLIRPGQHISSGPTDEEIEAFIKHNQEIVQAARLNAAGKVVRGVCETPTRTAQINCAALLRAYFDKLKTSDVSTLSGEGQAFFDIGQKLAQRDGTRYGCTISTAAGGSQEIVCTPAATEGYIARAQSGETLYASSKIRVTPGSHVKKNMQPTRIALGNLKTVESSSFDAFAFGDISPAQDKAMDGGEVATLASPLRERLAAKFMSVPDAPKNIEEAVAVMPPVAAPSNKEILRAAIKEVEPKTKNGNGGLLLAGVTALVGVPTTLAALLAGRKTKPLPAKKPSHLAALAALITTAWSRRRELPRYIMQNKASIAGGWAGTFVSSKVRIGVQFGLAKAITSSAAVAAGATSLPMALATVGVAASTLIVSGAIGGATLGFLNAARSEAARQEKGWWYKSARQGANTGAITGLLLGGVADLFTPGSALNEYVGKPIANFVSEQVSAMPRVKAAFDGVRGFFTSLVPHGAGQSALEQASQATGMDASAMQAVTPDAPTPDHFVAPEQPVAPPQPEPVAPPQPEPVVPPQEAVTQAAADTVQTASLTPQPFAGAVPSDVYEMLGHDEAGKAIQEKMMAAANNSADKRGMLGAIKDASEHLLNRTHGNLGARQAGIKLLEQGHAMIAENARLAGDAVPRMIERDYGYVKRVFASMVGKAAPAL